ncbi:protein kinase [Terracoccus sp. 273MFTsu3.1]|uniref:protein kinase domain-containing protein n=1 Tax=Terracoccus sp. 273MFTsu3.1 TaxID=1172188 RepID=UPI0012DC73EA|nr:protein kinase [Terracoccus sp. 273MFTsu3.1]
MDYIHYTVDDMCWGLLLKLPPDLAEVVGTQREILLWASMRPLTQARDLQPAIDFLAQNSTRVSQDLVIVVTSDPNGPAMLREAAEHLAHTVVTLTIDNLRAFRPRGAAEFKDSLRGRLFSRDLYNLRSAVTRTDDFFGRTALLIQLERSVTLSTNQVALFGLRKIGKTSFILRLREALRNKEAGLIAQVDLQRANAINPSAEYLLWHLGESLWDNSRKVRRVPTLKLFGKYETFSDVPDRSMMFELFDHDLRAVNERTGSPIIILMDEIERIFPTSESSPWRHDFIRLWQLLRGFDQEQPGSLRLIISGTNPQCVERHAIFGEDNPIYSYFSNTYLGPLDRSETGDLLRSYGQKMGLKWADPVIDRAFEDTGGHPALLRTYASMMHLRTHPRHRAEAPSVEDARDIADNFLVEQGPLLAQVVAILEDQYEDEFEILNTLAMGKVSEFREMARAFPEDTAHLIGYGLFSKPSETTRLQSQLLQTYLQRRAKVADGPRALPGGTSLIGLVVDNRYEVQSLVSSHGGYADVYRARMQESLPGVPGLDVAIKVLRHGQLSLLEREVEVLQTFEHRNLVRFIDSGRTAEGLVYLAMEYLDGDTLRAYCEAATRPSEPRLLSWAYSLLDALVAIHPKESELRRLRAGQSSEGDLQELLEARYGYIHRDVKPENIIITPIRGPVLIDFNISVSVSTPVATVSATPGYLPPELMGPKWSPRVDIFQLGVTLLQVAAGDSLMGENRSDLVTLMRSSVSSPTAAFIEKLIDTSPAGYQTAYTARRDVNKLMTQHGG